MQTIGQYRVGLTFNPSNDPTVEAFKRQTAALIDECLTLSEQSSNPEVKRLYAQAASAYEDAAVYAVKGVTKPERQLDDDDPEGSKLQAEADAFDRK